MEIKEIIVYIAIGIVVIGIAFGTYRIGERINYSLNYEDMVIQTIREQVKSECLKK